METPKNNKPNKNEIEDILGDQAASHKVADPVVAEVVENSKVEVPEDTSKVHDIERTPAHWHIDPHPEDDNLIVASNGATGKVFTGTRDAFTRKYYKRY